MRLTLTTVNIGAPDPVALARFYEELLGWEIESHRSFGHHAIPERVIEIDQQYLGLPEGIERPQDIQVRRHEKGTKPTRMEVAVTPQAPRNHGLGGAPVSMLLGHRLFVDQEGIGRMLHQAADLAVQCLKHAPPASRNG